MTPAIKRLRRAIGRNRGLRALSLLLAFALLFVAWPQLEVHSHVDGGQAHSHALGHHAHDAQLPDDPDAPGVAHLHDASTVAWTLPLCQTQIAAVPAAAWNPALGFNPGAVTALPPPHRPPIA
jgi:hypothetical protein